MLRRDRFEKDLRRIFEENRFGSTVWSPLGGGLLSGKYNDGVKVEGGRYEIMKGVADPIWNRYFGPGKEEKTKAMLKGLGEYAKELGYTQA